MLLVVWGVVTITFLIFSVFPRDVAVAMSGAEATVEQLQSFREEWGLDQPMWIQYLDFFRNLLQGNLGISIRTNRPVLQEMADFMPKSIELGSLGMFLAIIIGIPSGIFSAIYRGKWPDHFVRLFSLTGVSIPNFWLGLLMLYVFYYKLNVFLPGYPFVPTMAIKRITGLFLLDSLLSGNINAFIIGFRHIIMPAVATALPLIGYISRQVRTSMLEILESDYIKAARSRGLPENKILFKHALKNSLVSTVSVIGISLGRLFSGSLVAEIVFAWPGMGYAAYQAILKADQPMIIGFTFIVAILFSLTIFFIDLVYGLLNPKIRIIGR